MLRRRTRPFEQLCPLELNQVSSKQSSTTMVSYLLFEIANGIFISIREKVEDAVLNVVLLQVIHKVSSVALQGSKEEM